MTHRPDQRSQRLAHRARMLIATFCGWLLETHGLQVLRRAYPRKDLRDVLPSITGKSLEELDTQWRDFLRARE